MKLIKFSSKEQLQNLLIERPPLSLACGFFDGVHKAHSALIKQACLNAADKAQKAAVFTFTDLPAEILADHKKEPAYISDFDDKCELIFKQGVEIIFAAEAVPAILNLSAAEFLNDILLKSLNTRDLFCGEDFHFAKNARGDCRFLKEAQGLETHVLKALKDKQGRIISSTLIRDALREGRVEEAADLLGRPFALKSKSVRGIGLASNLGFATVNCPYPAEKVKLLPGVYLSGFSYYDNEGRKSKIYRAISNAGYRPTVRNDHEYVCETHILNLAEGSTLPIGKNACGQEVNICNEFYKFIRPEIKFADYDALRAQVFSDIEQARNMW